MSSFLILDCKGKNLDATDGVLSLMCIGNINIFAFVFDVLALNSPNGIPTASSCSSLQTPRVKKVVWGCRNDFLEITATYGVRLGVLDLQLADIQSRMLLRGE
jgi:exonuclease 3'-5' domain-containing protein 1